MDRSQRRNPRAFRPHGEEMEPRWLLSTRALPQRDALRAILGQPGYFQVLRPNSVVVPITQIAKFATFVDPTVHVDNGGHVVVSHNGFVAPFAVLDATLGSIKIGVGTEIADSAQLIANPGRRAGTIGIQIGDQTYIGENATIRGPSVVGAYGPAAQATFVGPGAVIEGATIAPGAIVSAVRGSVRG